MGPGQPAEPTEPEFDVREYARTAAGCHRDDLDLAQFDAQPLAAETLRCLRYLRDLERTTIQYLRRVLVTPAHKDARVTAFLTTWAFEKYWIADLWDAVLERHQQPLAPGWSPAAPVTAAWRGLRSRLAPIGRSLFANTLGESVVAVHMATGSIDERLSLVAYQRVAELAGHPEVSRAVRTVVDVKSRHLAFFDGQARARLRDTRLARLLARTRLRRSGWPLSAADQRSEQHGFFLQHVFATAPALVAETDRLVQRLPGLERLTLLRAAVTSAT